MRGWASNSTPDALVGCLSLIIDFNSGYGICILLDLDLDFSNGVGISQDKSAYGNLSADTIFIIISGSTSLWQLEIGNGWPAPMVYRLANDQNT